MKRHLISELQQRSQWTFLKYRAPCAAALSIAANGRSPPRAPPTAGQPPPRRAPPPPAGHACLRGGAPPRGRRLPPGPTLLHPSPQNGIAQAKSLGHRPDRAATRSHQIDRLSLVVVCKRGALTSYHPTAPGSPSLLQVSINSEEVQSARSAG